MDNDELKALKDFDRLVHDPNGDMQEFINLHRNYCRTVEILANVRYLYLLLNNYYDVPNDDKYKFLDKLFENRDLMMEENI
ncbi:hypothetical protein [Schleiferilactobacillus harbinensis]|uniref:hypothetical protein n=1 Tax=Schleiferilactobacillus harbinensis TaxID=304207 RepID=UPI0007B7BE0C|nr:hypothetical protein [Schleiferilactobacillus harbinensis]